MLAAQSQRNGHRTQRQEVDSHLLAYEYKALLRFVMCGSVDDGKSTLIGRLLYESQALLSDQLAKLEADSKRVGTQQGELDFALALDGLSAERAQGITIDVAYRHFSTTRRHFIVADAPGHEQYTRNTVTGASTADCAVVLVDACKGVLDQTRRHSQVLALLGVHDVALAVNKMDLVDYSESRLLKIEEEYRCFADRIGIARVTCIPVSALNGDNLLARRHRMRWYDGPTLLEYLETVDVDQERMQDAPFRLPVQWVNRPSDHFRGYAGMISGGSIRPGDEVVVSPSGRRTRVERIVTREGDRDVAYAGESITVTLTDELGISRGDVIGHHEQPPGVADRFNATIIWMAEQPMLRGRDYLMRIGTNSVRATVAPLKYKLSISTGERVAATSLELNEIGVCDIGGQRANRVRPIPREPRYRWVRARRQDHERHGWSGNDQLCAAPLGQRHVAAADGRQALAGRDPSSASGCTLVHGTLRCWEVDYRESRRARASSPRAPHVPARRRQRAARPQQ